MASIGGSIFDLLTNDATLSALVGTRVYPQVAPQESSLPRVVYTVVDDVPVTSLQGATSQLSNARIQIDCYGDGYLSAQTVADAICSLLDKTVTSETSFIRIARRDMYDDESSLYRVLCEFSLWRVTT